MTDRLPPDHTPRPLPLTINGCAWLAVAVIVVGVLAAFAIWILHVRSMGPA
jgi:hypothetical protein